jgi:hypothetical protein
MRASKETDARAQGLKQSSAWPSCSVDGACSSCRNNSHQLTSGSPSFLSLSYRMNHHSNSQRGLHDSSWNLTFSFRMNHLRSNNSRLSHQSH